LLNCLWLKYHFNPINFLKELTGGDLRSIGAVNNIVSFIITQVQFDELFSGLFHQNRLVVMRTADAIEKLKSNYANYRQ